MCNSTFNPRLAPVTNTHVPELQALYPDQSSFIADVYTAMTRGLAPQANLLVLFTLLRHQYQKKSQGILSQYNLLYVPLSIVAKTGHAVWTRFRPKAVKELHTAFLSFMMAETNRNQVSATCVRYGVGFGQGHCCGVLFGTKRDIHMYQHSELYRQRNLLRSSIESLAMPVEEISFDNVPEQNIDLGPAEREFFELYEATLKKLSLPHSAQEVSPIITGAIDGLWEKVLSVTPTEELVLI